MGSKKSFGANPEMQFEVKARPPQMDFETWRTKAREYLLKGLKPKPDLWEDSQSLMLDLMVGEDSNVKGKSPKVPAEFLKLAETVSYAKDHDRWHLLYSLLYRLNYENSDLLKVIVDDEVIRLNNLNKSIKRDIHKMHAFVRFKKVDIDGEEKYFAWHQAEHFTVKPGTPFFVRRFGDKPWSIFTPFESAHWDLKELTFGEGMEQRDFKVTDPFDEMWKTYYKSIYNPARLKIKMMKTEMAPKYWAGLPEAEIIRELIQATPKRLQDMAAQETFLAKPPVTKDWSELKQAALQCQACPLYKEAHQTVFGEGDINSPIMIVGEQPGDEEDTQGKPFVGPAGQLFDSILDELGVDRSKIYITNAVKHFKWTPKIVRDKKIRLHKKASGQEMHACKPWLEAEIAQIKPKVIIALGVTAGTALWGRLVKLQEERGEFHNTGPFAPLQLISWHPSAILRAANDEDRRKKIGELKADLQKGLEASLLA